MTNPLALTLAECIEENDANAIILDLGSEAVQIKQSRKGTQVVIKRRKRTGSKKEIKLDVNGSKFSLGLGDEPVGRKGIFLSFGGEDKGMGLHIDEWLESPTKHDITTPPKNKPTVVPKPSATSNTTSATATPVPATTFRWSTDRGAATGTQQPAPVESTTLDANSAATRIQASFRGASERQKVKDMRDNQAQELKEQAETQAAVSIQALFRGSQGRKLARQKRRQERKRQFLEKQQQLKERQAKEAAEKQQQQKQQQQQLQQQQQQQKQQQQQQKQQQRQVLGENQAKYRQTQTSPTPSVSKSQQEQAQPSQVKAVAPGDSFRNHSIAEAQQQWERRVQKLQKTQHEQRQQLNVDRQYFQQLLQEQQTSPSVAAIKKVPYTKKQQELLAKQEEEMKLHEKQKLQMQLQQQLQHQLYQQVQQRMQQQHDSIYKHIQQQKEYKEQRQQQQKQQQQSTVDDTIVSVGDQIKDISAISDAHSQIKSDWSTPCGAPHKVVKANRMAAAGTDSNTAPKTSASPLPEPKTIAEPAAVEPVVGPFSAKNMKNLKQTQSETQVTTVVQQSNSSHAAAELELRHALDGISRSDVTDFLTLRTGLRETNHVCMQVCLLLCSGESGHKAPFSESCDYYAIICARLRDNADALLMAMQSYDPDLPSKQVIQAVLHGYTWDFLPSRLLGISHLLSVMCGWVRAVVQLTILRHPTWKIGMPPRNAQLPTSWLDTTDTSNASPDNLR